MNNVALVPHLRGCDSQFIDTRSKLGFYRCTGALLLLFALALTGCGGGSGGNSSGGTTVAATKPLNDTGITSCADFAFTDSGFGGAFPVIGSFNHNNDLDCSVQPVVPTQNTDGSDADMDIIRGGQDALYGRDVTNNNDADGHAGFSFTQLDSTGTPLTTKSTDYNTTPWSCIRDNVTGLIWEVKTTIGLQNLTSSYSWYNSTGINNGGLAGTENGGTCTDGTGCDTEKYVADVNALNICGEVTDDWRLPTRHELLSIVNNSKLVLAIDINYFPNTQSRSYWSSTPLANGIGGAWDVSFDDGRVGSNGKGGTDFVRLVRGG